MLAAYAVGDRDIVSKTLTDAADFREFNASLTADGDRQGRRVWRTHGKAWIIEIRLNSWRRYRLRCTCTDVARAGWPHAHRHRPRRQKYRARARRGSDGSP